MITATAEPSSHILTVPVSDEQICESVSDFLAGGLAAGDRVAYFDDGMADAVLSRLFDDGVDVAVPLRTGQFQLVPADMTRSVLLAPLEDLPGVLDQNMRSAVDDGWAGLRFTGQMTHGLTRPGGHKLDEYDRIIDRMLRGRPAHALCVYDHARYPDELISAMRELHDTELAPSPLLDDSLLRITGTGPGRVRLAGEVDHGNRPQVRRVLGRLLDQLARGEVDTDTIVADLSTLRFCDVAATVSVVHAAQELPVSVRLRLENVRPGLARLFDRCGAGLVSQLEIDVRERDPLSVPEALALAGEGTS